MWQYLTKKCQTDIFSTANQQKYLNGSNQHLGKYTESDNMVKEQATATDLTLYIHGADYLIHSLQQMEVDDE